MALPDETEVAMRALLVLVLLSTGCASLTPPPGPGMNLRYTLEQAHYEAIHGCGDWKLGRTWPGEWNR